MFVSGLVLWSAAVLVTMATGNANLIPTIILLGSFLVPVTFMTYAFGHADQVVTAQRIAPPSSPAGCSACWAPPFLEAALLRQPSGPAYLGVGLVEEAVKLATLWLWRAGCPATPCETGSC
jgi:hypothetical protein